MGSPRTSQESRPPWAPQAPQTHPPPTPLQFFRLSLQILMHAFFFHCHVFMFLDPGCALLPVACSPFLLSQTSMVVAAMWAWGRDSDIGSNSGLGSHQPQAKHLWNPIPAALLLFPNPSPTTSKSLEPWLAHVNQ